MGLKALSYNHRVTCAGKNLKNHLVPTPCHGKGHFPLEDPLFRIPGQLLGGKLCSCWSPAPWLIPEGSDFCWSGPCFPAPFPTHEWLNSLGINPRPTTRCSAALENWFWSPGKSGCTINLGGGTSCMAEPLPLLSQSSWPKLIGQGRSWTFEELWVPNPGVNGVKNGMKNAALTSSFPATPSPLEEKGNILSFHIFVFYLWKCHSTRNID